MSVERGPAPRTWPRARARPGVILAGVTNNHRGDAADAARLGVLSPIGAIRMHKGKYRFVESAADGIPENKSAGGSNKEYLRETSRGFEYVESETYYLFRKTGARKEPRIARIRNGFHKNKSV